MNFKYKALKDNKMIEGQLQANSEAETVEWLRKNGFFPVQIKGSYEQQSTFASLFNRITFNDIVDFTRQLSIMLNAGLTIIDSFDILKKQIIKPQLKELITGIDANIRGGKTYSSSLTLYPQYFSNLYISLVKSGEASGKLDMILLKLADTLEKQREFGGKIKGALIYPAIILIGMIVVVFIMITFVVPRLLGLYKDFNVVLPISTQILIAVSNFFQTFWPLLVGGLFIAIYVLLRYVKTEKGRYVRDNLLLKMPVFGNVIKKSALVDSTRTLSVLVGAGVSILDAISITVDTSDNIYFRDAFKTLRSQVEKGIPLGQAMNNEPVFPPILVQMTHVGEQTGHLDETLMRISKYFEYESDMAVKTMTTMIEPLILVVLGLVVGFLVLSVISPIYSLTNAF
ncbi:MAG: type II secretion system F family protein [Candidatus Roizmanbacteria bacterium]